MSILKKIINIKLVIVPILIIFLLLMIGMEAQASEPGTNSFAFEVTRNYSLLQDCLNVTNQHRQNAGVPPLTLDSELTEAAMIRAAELKVKQSHTRPNGTHYESINSRVNGENYSAGMAETGKGIIDMWMGSQVHRDTILRGDYKSVGFGIVDNTYCIMNFSKSNSIGTNIPNSDSKINQTVEFEPSLVLSIEHDIPPVINVGQEITAKIKANIKTESSVERFIYLSVEKFEVGDSNIVSVQANGSNGLTIKGLNKGNTNLSLHSANTLINRNIVVEASDQPSIKEEFGAVYRLYQPLTGEHLFTTDVSEAIFLSYNGWNYEGIAWYNSGKDGGGEPITRLYNKDFPGGEHLYTTNYEEADELVKNHGWEIDATKINSKGNVPIYRLYNPESGRHHYTIDQKEYNQLPSHGWNQEGIAFYGLTLKGIGEDRTLKLKLKDKYNNSTLKSTDLSISFSQTEEFDSDRSISIPCEDGKYFHTDENGELSINLNNAKPGCYRIYVWDSNHGTEELKLEENELKTNKEIVKEINV